MDADVYRRQVIVILHSLDGMRVSEAYWQVYLDKVKELYERRPALQEQLRRI